MLEISTQAKLAEYPEYTGVRKTLYLFQTFFFGPLMWYLHQKVGNKSKFFFPTLQRFNMGALRDTTDI
jgi:hypothetical protein